MLGVEKGWGGGGEGASGFWIVGTWVLGFDSGRYPVIRYGWS